MRVKEYDIGLVCVTNRNIGNNLTNYALYQYLFDLGCNVLLMCNPGLDKDRFCLFKEYPYSECNIFIPDKIEQIYSTELMCNTYVLGSDQLWRYSFAEGTDYYTCLGWVDSRKYKVAYATSFGIDSFEGDEGMREKMRYLLNRFQKVSVRERDGVRVLKEIFHVSAECVLDPVFLCEKKHYLIMAEKGRKRLPENKYVGAYLLDICEEKEKAVLQIADSMPEKEYCAITQSGSMITQESKLRFWENPLVEEWLAMIENCDFLVTDSFHGLCFAIIFQKQFCVLFHRENWRGVNRIQSLLNLLDLQPRLLEEYESEKVTNLYEQKIDYGKVNVILTQEREKSRNWLGCALEEGTHYEGEYDVHEFSKELFGDVYQIMQRERRIESERQKIKDFQIRNEIFLLKQAVKKNEDRKAGGIGTEIQLVGWGAGDCFKRNIRHIKSFYNMKYVCDSNPEKWGKEIAEQVFCISPKMLSEMNNVVAIIMVDNAAVSMQIINDLRRMGIHNFEHVKNWLAYIEGKQ